MSEHDTHGAAQPPEFTNIHELIGRAAYLMRQRAIAANTDNARRPYGNRDADPVAENEWPDLVANYLGGSIGTHCAYLTPAVALAVAAWLDHGSNPGALVDFTPMVAVARAYLGQLDTSPSLTDGAE